MRVAVVVAALLLAAVSGCGGGNNAAKSTTTKATTTPIQAVFKATLVAPNHHPIVNQNWPITVKVTNLADQPIAATVQMNVLFGGAQVGRVDNGKIYRFKGRHHEIITWPVAAVGHQLTLQFVVKAGGMTKKILWQIVVMKKK
jgi:hypothetical protein